MVSYSELGARATAAVVGAMDAFGPKLEADTEPLELWLYAVALRIYTVLSGLTEDDDGFDELLAGMPRRRRGPSKAVW